MQKHRLLLYSEISRRVRGKVLLMVLYLALIAGYDMLVEPVLGNRWYVVWVALAVALLLWLYYGVLMRRAALQVRPGFLRLQGPLAGMNISYGRIHSVTSTLMSQQYPKEQLTDYEKGLLSAFYGQACVLVEFRSHPKAYQRRRWWFPRLLFGNNRPGLLLLVEDWMSLSRDIETARARWYEERRKRGRADGRSLASRVMDLS